MQVIFTVLVFSLYELTSVRNHYIFGSMEGVVCLYILSIYVDLGNSNVDFRCMKSWVITFGLKSGFPCC